MASSDPVCSYFQCQTTTYVCIYRYRLHLTVGHLSIGGHKIKCHFGLRLGAYISGQPIYMGLCAKFEQRTRWVLEEIYRCLLSEETSKITLLHF